MPRPREDPENAAEVPSRILLSEMPSWVPVRVLEGDESALVWPKAVAGPSKGKVEPATRVECKNLRLVNALIGLGRK